MMKLFKMNQMKIIMNLIIFEKKDDDKKCIYIKSAVGGFHSEDFYMIIDGYVPKSHAKIIIGNFEPSQKFMLVRKV